ncbi:MAG: hypothetical protein UFX20_08090 [Longibaculum muris]|uniref:Uncharacterized protein n=1 Tax=Longibaculum muris TaxID=1796628 RepID=A0A4R3YG85_9FIRM|nr:hypothetical protein [Longibaculum muris]KXU48654.1 hypothetical protein HMPREF3037_01718 [Candidatus Stoquefichus sp. KLE1796]MBS5370884.1 hypothetical protein [Coprobacillus cateniformis]MCR1889443.1 hypothetical protein [Longibaculum muris]MED9812044.1 hypothetical protein [Longibaculum muris]TCV91011.1 hypothetical protein EDD60_1377 [Longibaculum muris]
MNKEEKIIEEAKESYETYFKESEGTTDEAHRGKDIILDNDKLEKEISKEKEDVEKKHESLEVLREKINEDAEKSYETYFKESEGTTDDEYRGGDVVLDVDKIEKEIAEEKETITKK